MKLDDFISNVLQDINRGIQNAKSATNRDYHIQTGSNDGVSFDIAVTTVSSSGSEAKGNAKAGFIEVLGADVGATLQKKDENSEVSRIQFTIYVPPQTEAEIEEDRRHYETAREEHKLRLDPY
jgi:hypothetical protein